MNQTVVGHILPERLQDKIPANNLQIEQEKQRGL